MDDMTTLPRATVQQALHVAGRATRPTHHHHPARAEVMTQELTHIEHQIAELQRKAEEIRTTMDDPQLPAAWRKKERGTTWYRYLQLSPKQGELFRLDGWEPLYRRQQRMAEVKARALARAHRGVALVRATEAHHGIH